LFIFQTLKLIGFSTYFINFTGKFLPIPAKEILNQLFLRNFLNKDSL